MSKGSHLSDFGVSFTVYTLVSPRDETHLELTSDQSLENEVST